VRLAVGGVRKTTANVVVRQLGVVGHDLICRLPQSHPTQHVTHADTHVAHACATASARWIDGDGVVVLRHDQTLISSAAGDNRQVVKGFSGAESLLAHRLK
jgi:hypothetical protein